MAYTTSEQFQEDYDILFSTFESNKTKSLAWRKWQLKQLWWLVEDNESLFHAALAEDLGMTPAFATMMEFSTLKKTILWNLDNVEKLNADEIAADAGFLFKYLGGARVRREPLGVVLLMGAANAPSETLLSPLCSVIAAGCCCLLKPSELNARFAQLITELLPKYMDTDAFRVFHGGPAEMQHAGVLDRKFNKIFFTGGSKTARIISEAAAKHLTPVTLELGGRAPAIVCPSANLDIAAKRISWSKYFNSGMLCVAANHVVVHPDVYDKFVERVRYWHNEFVKTGEQGKIIHENYYDKLDRLVVSTKGKVLYGGDGKREERKFTPTIVGDVLPDDPILSEEIFGCVLPIVKGDYKKAVEMTKGQQPLALYIFSEDQKEIDYVLNNTISGGVCINDCVIQVSVPGIPFGGVGESGHGQAHFQFGFAEFVHFRPVVRIPYYLDKLIPRYPPWTMKQVNMVVPKNPGFRRGETLKDQRVGRHWMGTLGWGLVLGLLTAVGYEGSRAVWANIWRIAGNVAASRLQS